MKIKNTLKLAKQFIQAQGGVVTTEIPMCQMSGCGKVAIVRRKYAEDCFAYLCDFHRQDDLVMIEAAEQNMHLTLGESAASDSESKPAPKRVI